VEVKKALENLKGRHEFKVLLGWLETSLDVVRKENDDLDGLDLTRNQGCAKTLTKIVKTLKDLE
jgi:hypothetical protein